MNYKIIKKELITTTNWSGGTTSELFIYPAESSYKKRDFDFRISTATVEIETSVFTPLDNVNRTLLILDGEMELSHKNEHTVLLKKFDQDNFDGGWETSSVGKCIDFNLMCRKGSTGEIEQITSSEEEYPIDNQYSHYLFYNYKGDSTYRWSDAEIQLEEGDVLIIKSPFQKSFVCDISSKSEIICCKIKVN